MLKIVILAIAFALSLLHLNTASDYLAPFLEEASSWKLRFSVYLLQVKFIDKKSFT